MLLVCLPVFAYACVTGFYTLFTSTDYVLKKYKKIMPLALTSMHFFFLIYLISNSDMAERRIRKWEETM
jgi:hypothetical protein